jgi:hypothetical protein
VTGARTADAAGWAVIAAAVAAARARLGEELAAAYAIGSLAHGGFAPAASDVDLALLTEGDAPIGDAVAAVVAEVAAAAAAGGREGGLGARLSVFHAPWRRLGDPPSGARFPAIDRLDLLDHGVLVAGREVRDPAARPAAATVIDEAVAFTAARLDVAQLDALIADAAAGRATVRQTTKLVLAPVRLAVLVEHRRVMGNADAADLYAGAHAALVHHAVAWRDAAILPPPAALSARLADGLRALHVEQLTRVRTRPGVPDPGRLDAALAALAA